MGKRIKNIKTIKTIKNNDIMSFAATWMDLEIVILSEVSQANTNIGLAKTQYLFGFFPKILWKNQNKLLSNPVSYNVTYMWNLNLFIKTEIESQMYRKKKNLWLPGYK